MDMTDAWRAIRESLTPHGLSDAAATRPAGADGRRDCAWHALFSGRARSLMVPAYNRSAQRGSLRFFVTSRWNRLYAGALLRAHRWIPQVNLLPQMSLPLAQGLTLLDEWALPESTELAFMVGTPGPYQKASVLIMSEQGDPLALAKIALRDSADEMVDTEARWLEALADDLRLRGRIPRLLRHGRARNGRSYLALSVAPAFSTTYTFTDAHAGFLRDLARVEPIVAPFRQSPAFHYLLESFDELEPRLNERLAALLIGALEDCAQRLARWRGPFVVAHGDFAPWNVRVDADGVFVFDWEYASEDSMALRDVFHFHLAPPAVSGRGLSDAVLQSAIDRARDYALDVFPAHDWNREVVAVHALAYLLHTVLCYSLSRGRVMEDHPVIRAYCKLIEERASWIG